MDIKEAIALVRRNQTAVIDIMNSTWGLCIPKAQLDEERRAVTKLLAGLTCTKPTEEEVREVTNW